MQSGVKRRPGKGKNGEELIYEGRRVRDGRKEEQRTDGGGCRSIEELSSRSRQAPAFKGLRDAAQSHHDTFPVFAIPSAQQASNEGVGLGPVFRIPHAQLSVRGLRGSSGVA